MRNLRILKFGGSSVGSPDKIQKVARLILEHKKECQNIVVVVSAMGDTTDDLIELALKVSPHATSPGYRREMDMLLTAGERIAMALLAMALSDQGIKSRSLTGSQSGIITDTSHGEARIVDIKPFRIEEYLKNEELVIVAGFQGVSKEKEVTTLGRGGSDTTAVALGVALNADEIFIYTDVSGFYSADPRLVKGAKPYSKIDSKLAYVAAACGSQVLHPRCLELAAKFKKPIYLKNTFSPESPGSMIKEMAMSSLEGPSIKIISHQKDMVFLKTKAPSTRVLKVLFEKGLRPLHVHWEGGVLSFTLPKSQVENVQSLLSIFPLEEKPCHTLSLLGYGFESHPEMSEKILQKIPENLLLSQKVDASSFHLILNESSHLPAVLNSLHELVEV